MPSWPVQHEGDFVLKDYVFESGETLPELKLHYTTIGTPHRNAASEIDNAVLLLHGTSGTGKNWLLPSLADELFGAGQPLDASCYYIVMPDGIGCGGSSKPSDGLRAKFPHYRYRDIIASQYRLLTEHLCIGHLRLVLGSSMGGMHCWMWGGMYPGFMDALVPIASQPVEISGRNWISRRIAIEAIRNDPGWNEGNYTTKPTHYIRTAPFASLMTENVVRLQEMGRTREAADALYRQWVANVAKGDANDQLYATEAVMDYDPAPLLGKITAKLLAINFADDAVNPAELGVVEPAIRQIPGAKFVLVPASAGTHGHFTHLQAAIWKPHLAEFLATLG
ncbi:alpha/beta fold hydrolase [Reyranella sp.]|uniref:alpha/beta fold hydrolase n=1 Tax=Reyranella sp. TaxID=1929291 RepID=UPI003D14C87D